MKLQVTKIVEIDVKYLKVEAGIRYCEDSFLNGTEDIDGKMPCLKNKNTWCPIIDLDTGIIINWKTGVTAKIHYTVGTAGLYQLLDVEKKIVDENDGYVPNMLCLESGGYGDYIIMEIDQNGKINNFLPSFEDFGNINEKRP